MDVAGVRCVLMPARSMQFQWLLMGWVSGMLLLTLTDVTIADYVIRCVRLK